MIKEQRLSLKMFGHESLKADIYEDRRCHWKAVQQKNVVLRRLGRILEKNDEQLNKCLNSRYYWTKVGTINNAEYMYS